MASRRAGCGIFIPFLLLALALGGWSVWWNVLSSRLQTELDNQAKGLRNAGWQVRYDEPRVDGWPFRIRLTLDEVTLVGPSGHGLRSASLQAEALAYRLDHWVVIAPEGLDIARSSKGWTRVTAQILRASISGLTRQPPRVVLEMNQPRFEPVDGGQPFPIAGAERLIVNLIPRPAETRQAGVLFEMTGAVPRPGGPLASMSERRPFDLSAEAVVEEAWRLRGRSWSEALGAWSRDAGALTEVRVAATAGEDFARGRSERLTADSGGRLSGDLALNLRGGTAPLAGLAQAPGVDPRAAAAVRLGAQITSGLRGETSLTLRFVDGRTIVGPVNLGPAPKLF